MNTITKTAPDSRPTVGVLLSRGEARVAEISHIALWSVREGRSLSDLVAPSDLGDALESLRKAGHASGVDLVASPFGTHASSPAPKGCVTIGPLDDEWERRRTVLAHLLERRWAK